MNFVRIYGTTGGVPSERVILTLMLLVANLANTK